MEVVGMIFFWIFLIAGVVVIPFGIAGTFVIVADALIYGLITGFEKITLLFLGVLLGIAVLMEIIEAVFGAVLARKYGGNKWAMAGAVIGGFIGAVLGTPVTPVIGTVLGAFVGAFVGAALLQGVSTGKWDNALAVGLGAFLGAVSGKGSKIIAAIVMVVMIGFRVF
ncbi:MAG: DUF456 domain-containing protein [bacterium]